MKILRSQYLQLQCNAEKQPNIANNGAVRHMTAKNKQAIAKPPQEFRFTVAPTRFPNKNNIVRYKSNSSTMPSTNIEIFIENADASLKKLNVVVEYVDMSTAWLTKVYKTYENDLWLKKPRLDVPGHKWLFYCGLCSNVYKQFNSIKTHLNLHLNLYPYVCKICLKKYTGRKSATKHLQKVHKLAKHQWNEFLTS